MESSSRAALDDLIAVAGLMKHYGKAPVLRSLDLSVRRGEFLALAGANGAGKTTLIKILLDLVRATGGSVSIDGVDSRAREARSGLAYLPERFMAPRYLSGRQYLRLLSGLHGRAADEAELQRLCEQLDLDPSALRRRLDTYSKGMRQKLGLIGAFLSHKTLLLLDEPMSGLDPQARYRVKQQLSSLREQGTTVFYSTHLLADAEDLCDRIAILDGGRMRFVGTPAECCARFGADNLEEAYMRCVEEGDDRDVA